MIKGIIGLFINFLLILGVYFISTMKDVNWSWSSFIMGIIYLFLMVLVDEATSR